jgi:hypothetical protein
MACKPAPFADKVTQEIAFLACARLAEQLNERNDRTDRKRWPEERSRGTSSTLLHETEHGLVSQRILRDGFGRCGTARRVHRDD